MKSQPNRIELVTRPDLRQMAGLLLKQYVDAHWSCEAEKFKEPEATPKAKAAVRAMLPLGLKESISKVRNSVAYCVSAIASWDWPEQWPELFEILTEALKAGAGRNVTYLIVLRISIICYIMIVEHCG